MTMNDATRTDPEEFEDPLSDFEPVEYETQLHQVLAEEPLREIDCTPFATVPSQSSIGDAVRRLNRLKVSSLLVVQDDKLVGIFTERDVLEKIADRFGEVEDRPVAEVMTSDPTVVYETDPVGTAMAAIAVAGHRHVPVLKLDGTVMGIVSPKRLIKMLNAHVD
jgi:signal-transduction protein with cAMP-binding, CBS, and nucleotidyltransferase domain